MSEGLYTRSLRRWEEGLGDPERPGPLSFAAAAERDERESFPHEALALLAGLGLPALHVPVALGGKQESLEQIIAASYAVGRRDLSTALSAGLPMWGHLVWMAGTGAQREELRALLERNEGLSLAASEAEHGADLLSNACSARWNGARWALTGQKWPIGRATQCRAALVLARTREERGPRSQSWFLLGPGALSSAGCRRMDKIRTLGLRAADLSGLSFDGLSIGPEAMVGEPGAGLELALKVLQLTRPLVASLSLGPADTAVRLAARFAADRALYAGRATDLPTVRRALVRAWVSLQAAELVEVAVVRGAHLGPGRFSVASPVAKIVAPALARGAVETAASVLGARFFLSGTFERMYRDQAVVPVFDGSTEVCQQAIAAQLPQLLAARRPASSAEALEALQAWCTPGQAVPPLAYEALVIHARGGDGVLDALEALESMAQERDHPAAVAVAGQLRAELGRLADAVGTVRRDRGQLASRTVEMADAAAHYARLYALTLCVAFSLLHRRGEDVIGRPAWLWMAAGRLLGHPPRGAPAEGAVADELFEELRRRAGRDAPLSALPWAETKEVPGVRA